MQDSHSYCPCCLKESVEITREKGTIAGEIYARVVRIAALASRVKEVEKKALQDEILKELRILLFDRTK